MNDSKRSDSPFMFAAQEKYEAWCHTARPSDLDDCIEYCLDAASSTSPSSRAPLFHLLGKALCSRAVNSASLRELDEGIEYLHTSIINDSSTSDLFLSTILPDIASALHSRWHLAEQLDDLNTSIRLRRLILSLSSTFPCETQITSINALSTALFLRFTHFPRMTDLREVLELNQRAIDSSPDDPSRFGGLCNMAQSLLVAWDYDGEMAHIESATGLLREAVVIGQSISNTLDYALALNALSEAIQSRLHLSEQDIDECVSLDTLSLTFVPKGHRERPLALAALATTILVRYAVSFQTDDFVLYHTLHEELQSMLDAGYRDTDILADYWAFAENIAPYHSDRYALTSIFRQRMYILRAEYQPEQIDITISFAARSLAPAVFLRRLVDPIGQELMLMSSFILLQRVTSDDERESIRSCIAWLCRGKGIRESNDFLPLSGRIEDIEEEWLAFMPVQDSHPWASAFYFQFSVLVVSQEEEFGLEVVQWAQKYAHRAWDVHQRHVPWGYQIVNHLALLYIMQAEAECESSEAGTTAMEALDQTIHFTEIALTTCPPSRICDVQIYAVDAYIMKHRLIGPDSPHLSSAIKICRERCVDRDIDVWERYNFAERFVDLAKEFDSVHLLEALLLQVDIIYDIVSTQFSMPEAVMRIDHSELSNALETAAEHCFTVGAHESALRVLEKGRGMLWARLVQLQAHSLKGKNKSANDVAQLELILEAAAEERGKVTERGNMPWKRTLNLASRERRLDMDIQRLMERVDRPRLRDEDTRPFMSTVLSGVSPVVVLFAGVNRCDALVITGPDYAIQHVALPECDRETLDQLVEKARNALKDEGLLRRSLRFAVRLNESWDTAQDTFEDVLTDTWHLIVEPIMRALQIKPSSCPPRLWWYPTGPFWQLPLHAAGVYLSEDHDVSAPSVLDYVISSYLPPFSVASTLPKSVQPEMSPHILAVYQSALNSRAPLFNAEPEVRKIEEIAREHGIPVTVLGEHHATVKSISSALSEATVVHFALHGQQDTESPMESSLLLDNGTELKLSQLMELNLPNAELVFLSACQTATGDRNVSEEVIHIAAAMLFVGFRSAIGTMWSINDEDGPEVAGETYRYLLGHDAMDPARALHESVKMLRERHGVPAIRWAPFVHIGI